MLVIETNLKGCYIITPTVFSDQRGDFLKALIKRNLRT
ncbi:MAG: dTDP-4-dehydrorhamnose 3,5-epimerase-like enzyme [Flavobacteriaceae bacterium]|jgi:dTDP-4-dehydrorhamnose 3,5-epimerase-like enzyme